ncbi:S8 family serine peptidase [Nonomuraea sp. NN258]|uniref:S8 family peptidase n=1 Tax=Nonomuraea antri TaxID=2730852 RepID=UPI00156932F7|nr:S8 family serine peptidase [Nonomuraea antri]NRQ31633.1 S8 family serine peptidase [Nonomuraea antri]
MIGSQVRLTWYLEKREVDSITVPAAGSGQVNAEYAWGGATGRGVRVCVMDSGVEAGHPLVGAVVSSSGLDENLDVVEVPPEDVHGHGTACAGIVRRIAPECEIHSLRILDHRGITSGRALIAALRWAVTQGFDVINLSLSTSKEEFRGPLQEALDLAYFNRVLVVASAHNMRIESFPWRFSSSISVGSHRESDPETFLYNPEPPVEFFAPGQAVTVAAPGGGTTRNTGNSFATPHITGRCALILSKHPELTPFQVKNVLYLTAANVVTGR